MAVEITDKFGRASDPLGYAPITTARGTRNPGEAVLAGYDLSDFDADTPAFFITYKKVIDPATGDVSSVNQAGWKAIVNKDNNTFTNLQLAPGYTDYGQADGDFIEAIPTSFWANSLVDGLLVSHKQDGSLKLDQAMVKAINDATTPLATRREYFGTKATFDADPARFGWLFMEKDVAYTKATYQRLYDHLVAVDAASVKDNAGVTFKFADKFFGTVGVSLDATQTEFNTLGKNVGANTHTLTEAQIPNHTHGVYPNIAYYVGSGGQISLPGGNNGQFWNIGVTGGTGGGQAHNNIQPSLSVNYVIKA